MIGQTRILDDIRYWISTDTMPRFILISGMRGAGKGVLASIIAKMMKAYYIQCDLSVDSVREAVKNCYKCSAPTVYVFRDADKMSIAAKNAMLKITEEPPRQAYFIITVQNASNMLETLRSRATNIKMLPYSREELVEYYKCTYGDDIDDTILSYADVPGQIDHFKSIDMDSLIGFCQSFIDNIQQVTGVNAFKAVQKIKIKEDKDGYDADIFFHCLKKLLTKRCLSRACSADNRVKYSAMLKCTCEYHHQFNLTGVKKDSVLDMWVLKIREC